MNRLMSRRKAAKDEQNPVVPSLTKAFKKNKKPELPVITDTPKLDIANVLPPTDDFRTSLLLPSLSARFSMLREQDDPTSKLGKANDDSVLFPKRASRLNLFNSNYPGLSDIAEVSTLRGNSYYSHSGANGEDELNTSIMDRPRPAEGNMLFAGRQKIYKVPAKKDGQSHDSYDGESRGLSGKIVYDDDVTDSLFQRWRRENSEREALAKLNSRQSELSPEDGNITAGADKVPSADHSNRASASATSIESQSHGSEQGTAASSVVNLPIHGSAPAAKPSPALDTKLPPPPPPKNDAPVQNEQNSVSKPTVIDQSQGLTQSPVEETRDAKDYESEKIGELNFSRTSQSTKLKRAPSSADSRNYALARNASVSCDGSNRRQRSISPTVKFAPDGTPLVAALNPEDHGKATALGIFNRPARRDFDEDEYQRLQRKLYEGRSSPAGIRRRSPTEPIPSSEQLASPSGSGASSPLQSAETQAVSSVALRQRLFQDSGAVKSDVKPTPPALPPFQPKQHPAVLLGAREDTKAKEQPKPQMVHPAYRGHNEAPENGNLPVSSTNESELGTISEAGDTSNTTATKESGDVLLSPRGPGLRNLVRANLRPESQASFMSTAPPMTPDRNESTETFDWPTPPPLRVRPNNGSGSPRREAGSRHAIDSPKSTKYGVFPPSSTKSGSSTYTPPSEFEISNDISARAKQILEQANALRGQQIQRKNEGEFTLDKHAAAITPERDTTEAQPVSSPTWREELVRSANRHHREGSAETQIEREDLALDLAERRRLLQEKLKRAAQEQERSKSPKSSVRFPAASGGFSSILKGRSRPAGLSRESSPHRQRKFLPGNASSTSLAIDEVRESRSRTPQPTNSLSRNVSVASGGEAPEVRSSPSTRRDRSDSDMSLRSRSQARSRQEESDTFFSPRTGNFPPMSQSTRPSMDSVKQGCLDHSSPHTPSGRPRGSSRSLVSPPPPPHFPPPELPSGISSPASIDTSFLRPSSSIPPFSAHTTPPITDSTGSTTSSSPPDGTNSLNAHKRPINKSQISDPVFISTTNQSPTIGLPSPVPDLPPMSTRRRRTTNSSRNTGTPGSYESPSMPHLPQGTEQFRSEENIRLSRATSRKMSSESQRSLPRSRTGAHGTPPRSLSPVTRPPYVPLDEQLEGNMF
ncbi:hypothetical protein AAP_02087 [Ascosphaera apis ARSEF 7405]|uniref:Uncharacterized protein n=1 Tax=Ascosphaera apis ARSEF 7405 TaxID=392613 RepID=A0A168AJB1_9EURO|nr:hypothetical protein AAP_02087 [Ascosphaera apis ARSEF 7405]